jgi:Methyltransferase domain
MKGILIEPRIHTDLAEFYCLWRDACLGKWSSEIEEVKFLLELFAGSQKVKSIVDLGGGVGLHTIPLSGHGFDVTLFDNSEFALAIAKRHVPGLQVVNSSFENIDLQQTFDAAICMFSSINYLLDEPERQHFFHWLRRHVGNLVVIDQINARRLPRVYSDSCRSEDKHFRLNILREWHFEEDVMHTSFIYEFVDKESEATKIVNDEQKQKFLTEQELINYMGKQWRMVALLGEFDPHMSFDADKSPRMISIFKRV